ncbi:MAG: tRNA lysidine(34) synthetase TilS [Gemmatimonadales bacterium]
MTLRVRFDRALVALSPPPGPVVVAVSGGPDSLALLDLLAGSGAAGRLRLHVGHVDHGIHPESGRAADLARAAAARYGLPFHLRRLDLGPAASETRAREARYAALTALADELGAAAIFTAHHQDDQVETVLMRLLKGSGPAGLAGMAGRSRRLFRPLLRFERAELAAWVRAAGLESWDDPANRDPRHLRSWIRTALLPALRERVPDVEPRMLTLARAAARDRAAWDAVLDVLPGLDLRSESTGVSVAAAPLTGYDSGVVRAVLSALGRRVGLVIGPVRAARIERLLSKGRSGAVAELGADVAAELSFDRLRLFRGALHPWTALAIDAAPGRAEVGGWVLEWRWEAAPERVERVEDGTWLEAGRYLLRPGRPGDRIRPLGAPGRRLVVRCLQEARVPRSLRATWPVIESDGEIVWIPGVCRSSAAVPTPGTRALRIDAHQR